MEELVLDNCQPRKAVQNPNGKLYIQADDYKGYKNGKITRIKPE